MSWSYGPEWGQRTAPAPDCSDCARNAAQAARWRTLRERWWGPPAAAALGAGIAVGGMVLQRAPAWTVPVMAASGFALALAGPPRDVRCDVHRSVCPRCGGPGQRPPPARRQDLLVWAMRAAGAGVGLGVAVLVYAARMILTPWLFSQEPDLVELAILALFPVVGWVVVGGMARSRLQLLHDVTLHRRCPACGHRWTLRHARVGPAAP